jgi:hypothetical protein
VTFGLPHCSYFFPSIFFYTKKNKDSRWQAPQAAGDDVVVDTTPNLLTTNW